jgi:hypothetical protein
LLPCTDNEILQKQHILKIYSYITQIKVFSVRCSVLAKKNFSSNFMHIMKLKTAHDSHDLAFVTNESTVQLFLAAFCISNSSCNQYFDHKPQNTIADTSVKNLGLIRIVVTGTYSQCHLVGIHEVASELRTSGNTHTAGEAGIARPLQ